MAGLLWFAPDDATFSVHAPFHGGTTRVPHGYADGTGDALHFSQESAFWAFNSVANFLYPRWFAAAEVMARAKKLEEGFSEQLKVEELAAMALYKKSPEKAIEFMTNRDVARANKLVTDIFALFGQLMVTYRDGFRISSLGPDAPDHGGAQGGVVPKVEEVGYSADWYDRIAKDTGDHYKVPASMTSLDRVKLRALNKGVQGVWQPTADAVIV
eukprot:CAMPEP_0181403726 /NCGR_PEP_ID=MMETSP1110-20121109/3865_1 /TAXON_ID=174948 /ORGANISM="Symbiodinium sp., Strain CCMP421" /LENGTH=212 /DNA_ID=CAMNT_0023526037 /DNA_START=23 /DNA_END=661 /DNA_ORIENTATION=+